MADLPTGWRDSTAHEEFDITSGITLGPHRRPKNHPYPYLRVANVHRNELVLEDIAELEARPSELVGKTLDVGDLLIVEGHANPAEIGRCARATAQVVGFSFQNHLFRLRPRLLDDRFGLRVLNSPRSQAYWRRVCSSSSGLNTINRTKLGRMPIVVPPLPEQRQIAEVLDTVDEAIRRTEQIIAKLKQVKEGLLHDLLTRGIDDNGELRDPDRHPEQFKDSPLGRIPKGWDVASVDDEFVIASGITLGPHRRPKHNPKPYLRVANVHRDRLDLADVAQLEATSAEIADRQLAHGDLLVVEGHANPHEIGRCAMATSAVTGFTFQNHLFRLRPLRLIPEYGLRWLNSAAIRRYWLRTCASSSGLNTINKTKLRAVPVLKPPQREQAAIVEQVATLSARVELEATELEKLRIFKSGLMEDLLTGRVRVTPLLEAAAE